MVERNRKQSPEERTRILFAMNVSDLRRELTGRILGLAGSTKRVRIDIAVPYSKTPRSGEKRLGSRYLSENRTSMEDLKEGTLWAYPLRHRLMKEGGNVRQSLIVAKDHRTGKTCVQILRSSRYDVRTGEFVEMKREGDMASFLSLKNDDQLEIKFLDGSDILYIVKGKNQKVLEMPKVTRRDSGSDAANEYVRRIVD